MSFARPLDVTRLVREAAARIADDRRYQLALELGPDPLMVTAVEADLTKIIDLLIERVREVGPAMLAVYPTPDSQNIRLELASADETATVDLQRSR